MRFARPLRWSSKSALYSLTAFTAAALLLFVLLTTVDNADAQTPPASHTPTPTPTTSAYTPSPTPLAVANPQQSFVSVDSVDAGIHIIDGLIDAEQREHSETPFPQSDAAPSADQSSGAIWSFPDDMSQDLRDRYRAAFEVMHQLSEQRFGVSVNLAKLRVVIVDAIESACGVAYAQVVEGRRTIIIAHSCRTNFGTGEVREIASAVMAHEYFHALHFELENDAMTRRIAWLYEGGSEHFKNIYLHHIGSTNYIDERDYLNGLQPSIRANNIHAYQSYPPIRTHGGGGPDSHGGTIYEIGLLAVQYLLEQTGSRTHIDFFRRPSGETFEDIFGVSLDTFYTYFEAHLAAGLPLPGAPFIAPTPGPTHTPVPDGCDNGVVVPDPANNPDLVGACAALLKAAPTLAAEPPLNWSTSANISDWKGVRIEGSPPKVVVLNLDERNLTGKLPTELGSLSNLKKLALAYNSLTGEIPPELGNFPELTELSLGHNQFTGEIPLELGNLSNLEWLVLDDNQLTGEIPPELGNLSNLEWLVLDDNQLTGEIPPELGNLSRLGEMSLRNNQLTGEISPELGNLSNLDRLFLDSNQLTGEIPLELGNLSNLEWLFLDGNQLTGEIPPELGNLFNLDRLFLEENQLTGEIPPELGNLPKLTEMYLSHNQLTGEIPPELGRFYLETLHLEENQLSGEIPAELNEFSKLEELYISGNQFSGCLPVSLRDIQYNDFPETGLWFCNDDDVRGKVRELEGALGTVQGQVEALLTQMGTMERLIIMLIARMDALEGALPAATPTVAPTVTPPPS